eukprot:9850613-Karenia_brevis.AAC.1
MSQTYAQEHDRMIQQAMLRLLQRDGDLVPAEATRLFNLSSMPMALGGGGLRSAARAAPAAYWASWSDAIPVLQHKAPRLASMIVHALENNTQAASCLRETQHCRELLMSHGFRACPSWQEVARGVRPEVVSTHEPGEWRHGWQYHASIQLERHFRETVVLPSMDDSSAALFRSQSGSCSGRHLTLVPTGPSNTYTAERFRALLQRRLRLPLS